MDSTLIVNDVSASVATVGLGWTFLGFLCGSIVLGGLIYALSR